MALVRYQANLKKNALTKEDFEDITDNLVSLQFESALAYDEKELLYLRPRSHALTAIACAQATYFVSILSEARFELLSCLPFWRIVCNLILFQSNVDYVACMVIIMQLR
jgi:hypothetical protein